MLLPRVKSELLAKVRDQLRRAETRVSTSHKGPLTIEPISFCSVNKGKTSQKNEPHGGCHSMGRTPRCTFALHLGIKDSDLYSFDLFGLLSSTTHQTLKDLWFPKMLEASCVQGRRLQTTNTFAYDSTFPTTKCSYSPNTETEGVWASN